jgi:hypothetical protein
MNKINTKEIYNKLIRGECANFKPGKVLHCQGTKPCAIIEIESGECRYFDTYVLPLLSYPEFEEKYKNEVKHQKPKVEKPPKRSSQLNLTGEQSIIKPRKSSAKKNKTIDLSQVPQATATLPKIVSNDTEDVPQLTLELFLPPAKKH